MDTNIAATYCEQLAEEKLQEWSWINIFYDPNRDLRMTEASQLFVEAGDRYKVCKEYDYAAQMYKKAYNCVGKKEYIVKSIDSLLLNPHCDIESVENELDSINFASQDI